jgi:hypothetical protein
MATAQPRGAAGKAAVSDTPSDLQQFLALATKLGVSASATGIPEGPAVRIGDPYRALCALSLPRRGRKDGDPNDLVMPGETVYLTEDEAKQFLRHDDRDGRRVPVIEKITEAEADIPKGAPRLHPKVLSGPIRSPQMPQRGDTGPRPDPPGSSHVMLAETIPEMNEPAPGGEEDAGVTGPDAVDLLPGAPRQI